MSDSLWPYILHSPWISLGQINGVCSLSLFQGIFPTQGLSPGLWHCWQILSHLRHKGSPRILEWVAYPFSWGSPYAKNWTGVSCIAGRFFTNWTIREALVYTILMGFLPDICSQISQATPFFSPPRLFPINLEQKIKKKVK